MTTCRVCGHELGEAPCRCAKCQTPAHPDCFAYAGGCSIFGCGSQGARFAGPVPGGWRAGEDGVSLIPSASVIVPGKGRIMDRTLDNCFRHWRTTAQLELFSVLGQAWFAAVALGVALAGRWSLPVVLTASLAAVVLAHANTFVGLVRMGFILTSDDDESELAAPRRAAVTRSAAIARSRALHVAATALLALGLALGGVTTPSWAWVAVVFAALVPWFSLAPRWGMELPLLKAARIAEAPVNNPAIGKDPA